MDNRTEQIKVLAELNGPKFHPHFLIGDRVSIQQADFVGTGTISGLGSKNVIDFYLISLDEGILFEGHRVPATTVSLPGSCLTLLES